MSIRHQVTAKADTLQRSSSRIVVGELLRERSRALDLIGEKVEKVVSGMIPYAGVLRRKSSHYSKVVMKKWIDE